MILNIAICEDDRYDRFLIKQELLIVRNALLIDLDIDVYSTWERLGDALRKQQTYDVFILDIFLEKENGIELAKKIKAMQPSAYFAFITSSKDHAIEAFDLNALHYLTKPVQRQQLQELIERYYARIHSSIKKLSITLDNKIYEFSISTIQRIVSDRKGIDLYLTGREQLVHFNIPFMKVEAQLQKDSLIKISRGLLIHMDYITKIDGKHCVLKNGTSVLISRRKIQEVKQAYYDYIEKSRIR